MTSTDPRRDNAGPAEARPGDSRRRRHIVIALVAAALSLALGVSSVMTDARRDAPPVAQGPVLPDWEASVSAIAAIDMHSAQDRFTIERTEAGWILPSRGGHPVDAETLAALDQFLGALTYAGARTSDPDRLVRLGLGDPSDGGSALRITARDESGGVLSDLLIGRSDGRDVFVRHPGDDQSWAARLQGLPGGGLDERPGFASATDWIDLDFLTLDGIARTRITPETGPAYLLERASSRARNFSLREPGGWTPITAGAANGPGAGLSRLRFRDVRPARELTGPVVARHEAESFAGLSIRLDVHADGDERWAVIEARALTDDVRRQADALTERTDGWAYLLSELSVDRLLRPLDGIADPRQPPADGEPPAPGDQP